jgi:hypothetical protein
LILNRPSQWEKAMKNLLRALLPKKSPKVATRAERRACLRLENLETRLVPAVITDMTQLALQFSRHAGPTTLYLNFDGSTADGVSSFQSTSGDRNRDIHEILFRTQEFFAPFDVIVRRITGNGNRDSSTPGNSTVFIGDNPAYGTGTGTAGARPQGADADDDGCVCYRTVYGVGAPGAAVNGSGAFTPFSSSDFPSVGNKGVTHRPNSDTYDVAFVDPLYYNATTRQYQNQSPQWIAQSVAHEAGHTFGLVHVLSAPDEDVMSYNSPNTRFVNKAFTITDLNYSPSLGTTYHEPALQPKWQNTIYGSGIQILTTSTITTQNSFTFLKAVLGARSTAGDFANVADPNTVDPSYADGLSYTLGVGSSTTGTIGRQGDWDVLNLKASSSGWVLVDVSRYGSSTVDPVLMVYDSTGTNLVSFNDDRASGDLNSEVRFYAAAGQSFKVVVGGYGGSSTGTYTVSTCTYQSPTYRGGVPISPRPTTPLVPSSAGLDHTTTLSGTSSAGPRAQGQAIAGPASSASGGLAQRHSPAGRDSGLVEALSAVARGRHSGPSWELLTDRLFAG